MSTWGPSRRRARTRSVRTGSRSDWPAATRRTASTRSVFSTCFEHVSRSAGHDGGKERFIVGIRREHHAGDFRRIGSNLTTDLDSAAVGESDVENRHFGAGGRDPRQRFGHRGRFADNLDVPARLEQCPKAGPDDFMIVEEKHAQSHSVILPIAPRQGNPSPPQGPFSSRRGREIEATASHGLTRTTSLDLGLVPFRSIEDPVKLRRVLEATLLLEADLELPVLLRHFIEEARSMTAARYGALGVLNEDRTALSEFLTVGLEPDEEQRIGARPTGRGVLGVLINDPRPLRLSNLSSHDESFGFPPNHPPMTSFLGVPIKVRGEVYGNLYLTDKVGWSEFTRDDEALVEALALAAGIAIENARLHQRVQAGGGIRGPGPSRPGSARHRDPTPFRSDALAPEHGRSGRGCGDWRTGSKRRFRTSMPPFDRSARPSTSSGRRASIKGSEPRSWPSSEISTP